MQLNYAWICINCDEIFDFKDISRKNTCPRCGAQVLHPLNKWIMPLSQIQIQPKPGCHTVEAKREQCSLLGGL